MGYRQPPNRSKISREVIETICDYIAKGAPKTVACRAVKIDPSTLRDWILKAEEKGGLYAEWRRLFDAHDTDVVEGKCARLIHLCTLEPRRGGERARCVALGTTNVCRKRYLSDGCDLQ